MLAVAGRRRGWPPGRRMSSTAAPGRLADARAMVAASAARCRCPADELHLHLASLTAMRPATRSRHLAVMRNAAMRWRVRHTMQLCRALVGPARVPWRANKRAAQISVSSRSCAHEGVVASRDRMGRRCPLDMSTTRSVGRRSAAPADGAPGTRQHGVVMGSKRPARRHPQQAVAACLSGRRFWFSSVSSRHDALAAA